MLKVAAAAESGIAVVAAEPVVCHRDLCLIRMQTADRSAADEMK